MSASIEPSNELLAFIEAHFEYEPSTGDLYRLDLRSREWRLVELNRSFAYTEMRLNSPRVGFSPFKTNLAAVNICWFLYSKKWPVKEVDHIDRDPCNNKIGNLRLANSNLQMINRTKRSKRLPGVIYKGNTWQSQIKHNRTKYYLGSYGRELEAHEAYRAKYKELHGEELNWPYLAWHKPIVEELLNESLNEL